MTGVAEKRGAQILDTYSVAFMCLAVFSSMDQNDREVIPVKPRPSKCASRFVNIFVPLPSGKMWRSKCEDSGIRITRDSSRRSEWRTSYCFSVTAVITCNKSINDINGEKFCGTENNLLPSTKIKWTFRRFCSVLCGFLHRQKKTRLLKTGSTSLSFQLNGHQVLTIHRLNRMLWMSQNKAKSTAVTYFRKQRLAVIKK